MTTPCVSPAQYHPQPRPACSLGPQLSSCLTLPQGKGVYSLSFSHSAFPPHIWPLSLQAGWERGRSHFCLRESGWEAAAARFLPRLSGRGQGPS